MNKSEDRHINEFEPKSKEITADEYLNRVYPEGDRTKEQYAEALLIRQNNETLHEYNMRIKKYIAEH